MGRAARISINFLVGVYVANYLGPDRFGLLSYAISVISILSVFSALGLDQIVIRNLVRNPEDRDTILGTSFILKLSGSVFVILSALLAATFLDEDAATTALILIIAGSICFQSMTIIDFYFQANVQSKYAVLSTVISSIAAAMTKTLLILFNAPLTGFAWAVVLENGVLFLCLEACYHKRKLSVFNWRFSGRTARELLSDSWPLILTSFAVMIYMRIDQVMLKAMSGSSAVGHYAVSIRFSEVWYILPLAVNSTFFPPIIKAKGSNGELYMKRLQLLFDIMVWSAILISIPMTLFADPMIDLFFGPDYHPSATALKIHIWAAVFVFLGVAVGKWFIIENMQKQYFIRTLAGCVANIILNAISIPKYGINGAAFSTVISQFVSGYFSLLLFRKGSNIFWMATKSFHPVAAWRRIFRFFIPSW